MGMGARGELLLYLSSPPVFDAVLPVSGEQAVAEPSEEV